MQLNNFIDFINEIYVKFSTNTAVNSFISNWASLRQQHQTNIPQFKNVAFQQIELLKKDLNLIDNISENEISILKSFGIDKYFGLNGQKILSVLQEQVLNASNINAVSTLMQTLLNEINQSRPKINQLWSAIQPIRIDQKEVAEGEGLIEIIFNGRSQIININDCKEQFSDWFIILDGYAKLLNVRREDFQIIGLSKNSPTKLTLKSSIEITGVVLGIMASLITIEQRFAEKNLMIEQLKTNNLASDSLQKKFIKEAEEHLSKDIEKEIKQIVDNTLKEHRINTATQGDIKNSFQKGVEKQYNFVINGGDVKFYLNEPVESEKAKKLETNKIDVRQTREKLDTIKLLNALKDNQEATDKGDEILAEE